MLNNFRQIYPIYENDENKIEEYNDNESIEINEINDNNYFYNKILKLLNSNECYCLIWIFTLFSIIILCILIYTIK